MLIWFLMAIALVVIVAGGFAGRRYARRGREPEPHSHRGKSGRNHRGRGGH